MTFGWHYGHGWMMGAGLLVWVLFLVLIGLGIWLVVRTLSQKSPMSSASEAEEVLRRRFAAGEIDDEEYQRRLEVLRRK